MPFSSLADEIILQICNLTGSPDIDNFALVNKTTYRVCYERLKQRRVIKDNARIMASRFAFNDTRHHAQNKSDGYYDRWPWMRQLDEIRNLPRGCALKHVEYLELNGDLSWLQPIDTESANEAPNWRQGTPASPKQLAELQSTVERLGLELPTGFLRMVGDNELISRMYLGGNYFDLGSLVKCKPADDKIGGGYVLRFFNDQQGSGFWNLYLSPDGHYCIVRSPGDVECWKCSEDGPYGNGPIAFEGHDKFKLQDGIPIACEDLRLKFEHPNFEAWLAMQYFSGWCRGSLWNERQLGERHLEYLDYFQSKASSSVGRGHTQVS